MRTLRMFREDRVLSAATLVLAISVLWPLFVTPFLPLVDLGSTVGAANLLDDAAFGHGVIAKHYAIHLQLVPYWTIYLLLALLEHLVGPVIAVKCVVGLCVLLVPIAAMRLLVALGRNPRLGLWVFILSWDTNLYWGWITFQIGMACGLFVLARLIEMETWREARNTLFLTVIIALTHVHAVVLVMVAGGLLAFLRRPFWSSFWKHALALSGAVVVLVPWLWDKILGTHARAAGHYTFDMRSLEEKLRQLFAYTIDNLPAHVNITAAGFALLLAAAAGMSLLPTREVELRRRLASLVIVVALAGLYFGLPFAIWGPIYHWFTYPRYGTYLLIALLTLPRPALERWPAALALVPGVIAAVLIHQAVAEQFAEYGRYTAPYRGIIAALPRNKAFFPLDLDDYRFRGTREAVLGQLHGYAAAVKSCYDPHLFDEPNNPLLFRHETMLPVPNWRNQREFDMAQQGQYYDYVIVHPLDRDPFAGGRARHAGLKLIKQSGAWRLYKVLAPHPYPPR